MMPRKKLVFFVDEDLFNWLDTLAEAQAITKSQLLQEILKDVKAAYDEDELYSIANEIYDGTNWFMLDEN